MSYSYENTEVDSNWLAAYIYYEEPWEKLIGEAVKPFAERMIAEKHADQWFFIRYWERGPHIRLRFKGDIEHMNREIKPRLDEHFGSWLKANPSEAAERDWLADLPEEQKWFPNNSVQYIPYQPEIIRYGGATGILIAERQFEMSSNAIAQAIAETESWGYERALGLAIQMHFAFAYGLGMTFDDMRPFFRWISYAWLSRAYRWDQDTTPEEHDERREEVRTAFGEAFQQQKEMLIPFCSTLWQGLQEQVEFEQEWYNHWIKGMQDIAGEWKQHRSKIEFYETRKPREEDKDLPKEHWEAWPIFESYIHMTNNRLGILNRDEAFLGYLIQNTIDQI